MFDILTSKLDAIFKKISGKGKLKEKDIELVLREVRIALLEADVNYRIVKNFVSAVRQRLIDDNVVESMTPAQHILNVVYEEMVSLMSAGEPGLRLKSVPSVILLFGLQGSGKTTTAAKLANLLKDKGHAPLLVAADVYRPAAMKQLSVLGNSIDVDVFGYEGKDPVKILKDSIDYAIKHMKDVVLVDTAGRLQIDDELMEELERMKEACTPDESLLVVDGMMGQVSVDVAKEFNERLGITGIILTKLDGDAKGGAALSITAYTSKPVKFVGVGERIPDIEPFYPDRIASRILGMGDILSLVEKSNKVVSKERAVKIGKRLKSAKFDFNDLLDQFRSIKEMGPLDKIFDMLPSRGMFGKLKGVDVDEKELKHMEAIILSMTPKERANPTIIKGSRKVRIAKGSGTSVEMVNRLLKQYKQMKKLFRTFKGKDLSKLF